MILSVYIRTFLVGLVVATVLVACSEAAGKGPDPDPPSVVGTWKITKYSIVYEDGSRGEITNASSIQWEVTASTLRETFSPPYGGVSVREWSYTENAQVMTAQPVRARLANGVWSDLSSVPPTTASYSFPDRNTVNLHASGFVFVPGFGVVSFTATITGARQ